jgi:TolB-like protein
VTPDVFLSYNRDDQAVAKRFAEAFDADGMSVWWDVTLRTGDAYDQVTEEALRRAKAVVVLWSPRSVASHWVRAEATIAHRAKTLIPATIERCDKPVMFELTQTADLAHWLGETGDPIWLAFLGDVRRMVGKAAPGAAATLIPGPSPADSGIPAMALLPITCRGSGDELEILAEDLTEAITAELAHDSYCEVTPAPKTNRRGETVDYRGLGREFGARYVVEGKVRSMGETIQLNMQMIATAAGSVLWTKRFVAKAEEIEASLEKFAITVGSELSEQLLTAEVNRATTKSGPLSGWDHFLRAVAVMARQSTDSIQKAIEECRQAVAAAPDFGLAHALLTSALGWPWRQGAELDEAQRREMRDHTQRALQLSGDDPTVIAMLTGSFGLLGDPGTALTLAKRAVELYPNHPRSHFVFAAANAVLGNIPETVAALEHQESLTPFDRTRYLGLNLLGICRMLEGELSRAEDEFDKSLAIHPDYAVTIKWKAILASQLGKEEAFILIKRLREIEPAMTIDQHVREMMSYSGLRDRLAEPVVILRRLWETTEDSIKPA